MVYTRCAFVALLTAGLLSLSTATVLRCFVGEDVCAEWKDVDEAEYGTFDGKVVCCPPEAGQAILLNSVLPEKQQCTCQAGTAEKYANHGKSSASFTGPRNLAFMMIVFVGVFLF